MSTFILDLSKLDQQVIKEILGFSLTVGLNFKKLNLVDLEITKDVLFVETETKAEEKSLKKLLNDLNVSNDIINANNKVVSNNKRLGVFLKTKDNTKPFFVDKTTGNTFKIVKD